MITAMTTPPTVATTVGVGLSAPASDSVTGDRLEIDVTAPFSTVVIAPIAQERRGTVASRLQPALRP
jgi:hypothetical protein